MKKQFPILLTLLFSTISVHNSYSMDYLAHLAAHSFNYGAKALEYIVPAAIPAYMVYQDRQDFVSRARVVDTHTEQFVRAQLIATYPELKDTQIKVVKIPNSCFAAAIYNNTAYISVPEHMCDGELTHAQQLENTHSDRYTPEQLVAISEKNKLAVDAFVTQAQNSGYAVNPASLKQWQGVLAHEGSHLLHKDSRTRITLLATSVLVGLYATEKIKNYVDISSIAADPTTTNLVLEGLAHIPALIGKISLTALINATWTYWQEYRADQDSIARTKDASILQARAQFFAQAAADTHLLAHMIDHITNPHPSNEARAHYFNTAAQQLETKNA